MHKCIEQYLAQLKIQGKAMGTVVEYRFRLEIFETWLYRGDGLLASVTPSDMLEYRQRLLERGLAIRTINANLSTVRGLFDWLVLADTPVTVNPVPVSLHMQPRSVRIERLTDEELATLESWVMTLQPNLAAAFWLMIGTGCRVSEAAKLTANDLQVKEDGTVWINIQDAKWGSDRYIPVVDSRAAKIVADYVRTLDEPWLPLFRVSKRTLQYYATKFLDSTGISFHCHLLRHTFAAKLLEDGIPIQKIQFLLGHKNVNMTAHYTQSALLDVTDIAPSIYQERGTEK